MEQKEKIYETIAEAIAKNGTTEIVIREGKALPAVEPLKVEIEGVIDAPAKWAETKKGIPVNNSHVLVCRDTMKIVLNENERDSYGAEIAGELNISKEFKKMHINDGTYMTAQQMAELFKMNRAYFENRSQAMKLVSDLMTFKAKVNRQIESSDNNRGNKSLVLQQAVDSNLPESFIMQIPLFSGQPKQNIECEVYIRAEDLCCTIVSAQANEVVEDTKNDIMNEVIDRIVTALPGIAVIEI